MKLALGLLLIALALVGAYFVLSGQFPPPAASANNGPLPPASGQAASSSAASQHNGPLPPIGSGGVSLRSHISHFGLPVQVHDTDIPVRGAFQ